MRDRPRLSNEFQHKVKPTKHHRHSAPTAPTAAEGQGGLTHPPGSFPLDTDEQPKSLRDKILGALNPQRSAQTKVMPSEGHRTRLSLGAPSIEVTKASLINLNPDQATPFGLVNLGEQKSLLSPGSPEALNELDGSKHPSKVSFADESPVAAETPKDEEKVSRSPEPAEELRVSLLEEPEEGVPTPAPLLPGILVGISAVVVVIVGLVLIVLKFMLAGFCLVMFGGLLVVFAVFYLINRAIDVYRVKRDERFRMSVAERRRSKRSSRPESSFGSEERIEAVEDLHVRSPVEDVSGGKRVDMATVVTATSPTAKTSRATDRQPTP